MGIDWNLLSQFGDFIGGVATLLALGTIIYVLQQTKEMSTQNRLGAQSTLLSTYKDVTSVMLELDNIFIEHPEFRKYFYDGAVIHKQDEKYEKVLTVAEYFVDFMDMFVVMRNASPQHPGVNLPWNNGIAFFRDVFLTSPIIREYWTKHQNWYAETLNLIFDDLPNETSMRVAHNHR